MKQLYLLFILTISYQFVDAQSEWQEHFSHDRRAYSHLGHFVDNGQIVLLMGNEMVPMNTLETITGNTKKDQIIIKEFFTYQAKKTITGLSSKEILLIKAFDYDIPGIGAFSIHGTDNGFMIRDIYGNADYDNTEINFIEDAHLLVNPSESKQCVSEGKRYYMNEDDIITLEMPTEGSLAFHEGLGGDAYQIWNGLFRRIDPPTNGTIDLEDYDELYNNPIDNQLIVRKGNSLNRYSYINLEFLSTDILINSPLEIQFNEGGFYYLVESDNSYSIYYFSDESSDSELYYELEKTGDINNFDIKSFEVIEDDIYFIGLYRSQLINELFSYVQKRTLNKDFTPERKDLELSVATATREEVGNQKFDYTYKLTVTNLSDKPIDHFTIITNEFYSDFGPDQFHENDISQTIEPGESFEVEGEFTKYGWGLNNLTFNIIGVDFGIDSDINNNSFTADVIVLSNKETALNAFSISPNLSTDFITLKGNRDEIESLVISNIKGHRIELPNLTDQIDISSLPNGQYWLEVQTRSRVEQLPFMKL